MMNRCMTALLNSECFLWEVVRFVAEAEEKLQVEEERSLGTLLEDRDILWDVLRRIMDSDVQECRLVCRRWRDVCYDLPVKLTVSVPIEADGLKSLVKFQQARSIHLTSYGSWKPLSEGHRRDIFRCLNTFRHVTSVTTELSRDFLSDVLNDEMVWSTNAHVVESLWDRGSNEDVALSPFLKSTMQLAALVERPCSKPRALAVAMPPLKEMTLKLRQWTDLMDKASLPKMPHLTSLQFVHPGSASLHFVLEEPTLRKCLPCLASLSIRVENVFKSSMESVALKFLTQLETLELEGMEIRGDDVFLALSNMKGLHTLTLTHVKIQNQRVKFEQLSQLRHLQSLTIYPIKIGPHQDMTPPDLRDFVRLTKLHVYSCQGADCLPCVTSLKDVDISFCGGGRILRTHLLSLINLESLVVDIPVELPSSFLISLRKLKKLTLSGEGAKQTDLFSAIASCPDLTSLEFTSWYTDGRRLLRSLSLKSSLQSLTIRNQTKRTQCGCLILGRGYLTRLRYLTLIHFACSDDEVEELKRSLPSLRKLQIE